MAAEMQIIKYWLNKKCFYPIENIKAGNRNIDFIAVNFKEGKISKLSHIEVSCSISSTTINLPKIKESINKLIKLKFSNPLILKKVKSVMESFTIDEKDYDKILVLSMLPQSNKKEIIENFRKKEIKIYEFENILSDVIQNVDTHYYKDDTIRSLQIIKYLLLAKPSKLVKLMEERETTILKQTAKEKLLGLLLKHKKIGRALEKADEKDIAFLIKNSSLKPAKLAQLMADEILGKRSKGKFLKALKEHEGMKRFFKIKKEPKEEVVKKEKPLGFFFKD